MSIACGAAFQGPAIASPALRRPDIFGFRALHVDHTPLDTKWRGLTRLNVAGGGASEIVRRAGLLPERDKIETVNLWVNKQIHYKRDISLYGVADHWATASKTLALGKGDCEDFAILKMEILAASGIDRRAMFLAIVKDLVVREDHALLLVATSNGFVALDNRTGSLVSVRDRQDYLPVFAYGTYGAWLYGKPHIDGAS